MKYLVLSLFFAGSLGANAQKIRFTDHRNIWYYTGGAVESCDYNGSMGYGADTIIAGKNYNRFVVLNSTSFIGGGCYPLYLTAPPILVREDTVSGVIYNLDSPTDTVEHIYFDYRLRAGDTLRRTYYTDSVMSVDSVIINTVSHRIYYMKDGWGGVYTFLEGVGSMSSPVAPMSDGCFEEYMFLRCFSQGGNCAGNKHEEAGMFRISRRLVF